MVLGQYIGAGFLGELGIGSFLKLSTLLGDYPQKRDIYPQWLRYLNIGILWLMVQTLLNFRDFSLEIRASINSAGYFFISVDNSGMVSSS